MLPRNIAGALVLGLTLTAVPLAAQTVGDRYSTYDRPMPKAAPGEYAVPGRRVIVRERVAPRLVTIERVSPRGWSRDVWLRRGYRPVTLYIVDGRYYDGYDDNWDRGWRRADVRRVVVYERGGRYFRDWDGDGDHDRRDEWLARHDRWHQDHAYDRDFDRKHREWHEREARERREWERDHRDWHRDHERD